MKVVKLIAGNLLVFLVLLVICEGIGQTVALLNPSYQVLFLEPDRVTGWKHVPNFSWNWTGHYWYAADFNVPVRSNRHGFRDHGAVIKKTEGTKRVALLGNSFIEALQVPREKTADYLLEAKLNGLTKDTVANRKNWEVLNFGISNYGLGQYLLTWREYTRHYDPDYVAVFVAYFHMKRTVRRYSSGAFRYSRNRPLWVRPVFEIDERDSLVLIPARDYEEFRELQNQVIKNEFGGGRIRKRRSLVTTEYAEELYRRLDDVTEALQQRYLDVPPERDRDELPGMEEGVSEDEILRINLRVLETLGREVRSTGAKLVILDASKYFGDAPKITNMLQNLAATHDFAYVPVYAELLAAKNKGIRLRWPHDGHFNERGNEILAQSLFTWIAQDDALRKPGAPPSAKRVAKRM